MANSSGPVGAKRVIEQRRSFFYPCTQHFYRNPPLLTRGSGTRLYDEEGRGYVDFFAGVSVVACGHCNEEIVARTTRQAETLQHTCTIYLTEANARLAERLARLLPGDLKRSFFCNSGTEANEGALLAARLHTGRRGFISLEHSLHGRTYLTMSVTGLAMWRADPFLGGEDVSFIPRPHAPGWSADDAAERSIDALRRLLQSGGDRYAAMIAEPVQGNGGIIAPPAWYFKEAHSLLRRYGVLLIADEVQTGFGRTGRMFATEHFGVVPDILAMGKALGNGVPISAFAASDAVAASFTKPSASTFGGNPVAAETALAVLDYIERHDLAAKAAGLGERLHRGLASLKAAHPIIAEVRGIGLMQGLEIGGEPGEAAAVADELLERMKDRGYLLGKNGVDRNVVAFQPPLVITEGEIDSMLEQLAGVLAGIESERA